MKHKNYPDCGCKVITGFDDYCPLCRLTDQNELLAEIPTMCRRYEKRIAELEARLDQQPQSTQAAWRQLQRIAELEATLREVGDAIENAQTGTLEHYPASHLRQKLRAILDKEEGK